LHRSATGKPAALWRFLAILMALVLVAGACGDDDDDATDTTLGGTEDTEPVDEGEPQIGGSLTVGLEAETNSWLPGESAIASPGWEINVTLFDQLMARSDDGEIVPFLAESLEPNEDLTEWTLTLREGVTFHDGTPLNAEALKYNFDNLLTREGANTRGTLTDQGTLVQMEVVDDLTVTYVLPRTNGAFAENLTGVIGSPFSPAAHQQFGEDAGSNPVGTGPYQFVSWSRDDRLVVRRNDNYWREGIPYLDEIVFRPIPDEDTRLASLLSGEIQGLETLRQSIVTQIIERADQGDVQQRLFIGSNGGGAIYNVLEAPVDDQRVRLGLAHAIDQEQLIDVLGGTGFTPPQTQYWSNESPWYSEDVADAWPAFDPDRATELLDEYRNDPNRSDGKAAGSPIAVQFNCPPDPSLIELSQAYQAFWNNVGVEVQLTQVEQAQHIQNAIGSPDSDPPFRGTYMINCWRMGSEADPYIILKDAFGPVESSPVNFINYVNPTVDENLEVLRTSNDFDERYAAAEAIMMLFTEEVPNLWTGATAISIGLGKDLRGWRSMELPEGQTRMPSGEGNVVYWPTVWIDQG